MLYYGYFLNIELLLEVVINNLGLLLALWGGAHYLKIKYNPWIPDIP